MRFRMILGAGILFRLLLLSPFAAPGDSILLVRNQGVLSYPQGNWYAKDSGSFSALQDNHRILVTNHSHNVFYGELPFVSRYWFGFTLRLDSAAFGERESGRFLFLSHAVKHEVEQDSLPHYLSFSLIKTAATKPVLLSADIRVSKAKRELNRSFQLPISKGMEYRFESSFDFFSKDSAAIALFVNGSPVMQGRFFFAEERKKLEIGVYRLISDHLKNTPIAISLTDMQISDVRPYNIPPEPVISRIEVDVLPEAFDGLSIYRDFKKSVVCLQPFHSAYSNETVNQLRIKLFQGQQTKYPLFVGQVTDPGMFIRFTIPLPLDSGNYTVQAAYQTNFNQSSHWSRPFNLQVNRVRPSPVKISDVLLCKSRKSNSLDTISGNTWYDLRVKLKTQGTPGYLLVCLTHSDEPEAVFPNKGGVFHAASNYVFNLSLIGTPPVVFEKRVENAIASTELPPESAGVFLDASQAHLTLDTANGILGFRIRLSEEAKAGEWRLSALFVTYIGRDFGVRKNEVAENYSNFYSRNIYVSSSLTSSKSSKLPIVLAMLLVLALLIYLYFRRTRGLRTSSEAKSLNGGSAETIHVFNRIAEYIESNLEKKLIVKSICEELGISRDLFQQAFKEQNTTFLAFLNLRRIKKAEYFLLETNKNISEISFELGFGEAYYFAKVFKEINGLSPSDFRKNRKNN